MNVLVTGGAGYVGSHQVLRLLDDGHSVIIIDTLERGNSVVGGVLVQGDIRNTQLVTKALIEYKIDVVMHFAAYANVHESIENPLHYYNNNVIGMLSLLAAMRDTRVDKLVFSSSCAVYGQHAMQVTENTPVFPVSPYGHSKLQTEEQLHWIGRSEWINYVILRYFNPCGIDPTGRIKEQLGNNRLTTVILKVLLGLAKSVNVFGNTWPTIDGSCVRDYVHIADLTNANMKAMDYLLKGGKSDTFNIGTGTGTSVLQMIKAIEHASGESVPTTICAPRIGDPAYVIANIDKAKRILGWTPSKLSAVEEIARTSCLNLKRPGTSENHDVK